MKAASATDAIAVQPARTSARLLAITPLTSCEMPYTPSTSGIDQLKPSLAPPCTIDLATTPAKKANRTMPAAIQTVEDTRFPVDAAPGLDRPSVAAMRN